MSTYTQHSSPSRSCCLPLTSRTAAFTIGMATSGLPSPTSTKQPPDLVENIPNLYRKFSNLLCRIDNWDKSDLMLASTPLHSMVTSGLSPPSKAWTSPAISSSVFPLVTCQANWDGTHRPPTTNLVDVISSHGLCHLQSVVRDVGYDDLGGAHGLGSQEVDEPDRSGATDENFLANTDPGSSDSIGESVLPICQHRSPAGVDPDSQRLHQSSLLEA